MKNQKYLSNQPSLFIISKVKIFIVGYDNILDGGLPYNRTTVINEQVGSGKTFV